MRLNSRIRAAVGAFYRGDSIVRLPPNTPDVRDASQPLLGRTALITGAGGYLGAGLCRAVAGAGADLVLADIDERGLAETAERLDCPDRRVTTAVADITNDADIDRLCADFGDEADLLVNAANPAHQHDGLATIPIAEWQRMITTAVFGPVELTRRFAQRLRARGVGGAVVFFGSSNGHVASPWHDYSLAKAALAKAVQDLAIELAPDRVRVNAVSPGWVFDGDGDELPYDANQPLTQTPVGVQFIAQGVVFLLADSWSGYTTGADLRIDGGWTDYHARAKAWKDRYRES